jgi:uncharacterized protein (UPF0305 family)
MYKKNYLFAPFEDDDEKIGEFNGVVNALKYVLADVCPTTLHMESALHGLRVFIGRLESYYDDVIVAELIRDLKAEIVELKAEIKELKADYKNDMDASEELDDKHSKIIRDLEQENNSLEDQLKNAVYDYEMLLNSDAVK